jgi:hypothetical protein
MTSTSRSPEEEAARRSRIERLAHQIWESEGRPEGQAERHWSMAERLVEVEEEEAGAALAALPAAKKRAPRKRVSKKRPA